VPIQCSKRGGGSETERGNVNQKQDPFSNRLETLATEKGQIRVSKEGPVGEHAETKEGIPRTTVNPSLRRSDLGEWERGEPLGFSGKELKGRNA